MREQVHETPALGSNLVQIGLVWSLPVLVVSIFLVSKHPPSASMQDVLLKRQRVLSFFFFPPCGKGKEYWISQSGLGDPSLIPALSHLHLMELPFPDI